jgi:hypothetical protein
MGRALWVKALLGCTALLAVGGVAGMGLANFASDGSFEFYRQSATSGYRSTSVFETQLASATEPPRVAAAEDLGRETSFSR